MKRAGLILALAALLVNGPRLVLIFLQADGLSLPDSIEGAILAVTGIATGAVLTGGGMYIAHTLVQPAARRMRFLFIVCWISLLAFSVVLISPALVAALRVSELAGVLAHQRSQWLWSITAVLAVEVLAGGAMAAHALDEEEATYVKQESQPSPVGLLVRAVARRLENGAGVPVQGQEEKWRQLSAALHEEGNHMQHDPADNEAVSGIVTTHETDDLSKEERLALLAEMLAERPDASPSQLAKQLDVSRSTIYRDIETLQHRGSLVQDDTGQ